MQANRITSAFLPTEDPRMFQNGDERAFIDTFQHLLVLENLYSHNDSIVLLTKDAEFKPEYGRIQVYRMEPGPEPGDYIKVYTQNGTRALHGWAIFPFVSFSNNFWLLVDIIFKKCF